ncbi:MAG: hypothetical protein K5866_02615 [Treponema sp.]|nr:hypothetical protein [Treponema sp.]
MAKQCTKRKIESGIRLLILSLLLFFTLFTGPLTAQSRRNPILVNPLEDQKMYAKEDIKFEITIPKEKSVNIQVLNQDLPESVEIKTLRKTEYFTGEGGTLIELWYRFETKGNYKLPILPIMIRGTRRYYSFPELVIEDDPANMSPRMVIKFENGQSVSTGIPLPDKALFTQELGQPLKFTVYLQYSTQLMQFTWDIPQDSIFTQLKTYEITEIKYREKNYSNKLIPVADFEWTPLAKGKIQIPVIHFTATAYTGYRTELSSPQAYLEFTQEIEDQDLTLQTSEDLFAQAFDQNFQPENLNIYAKITEDNCRSIAKMRSMEKHALIDYFKIKKGRADFEEQFGLPSEENELNLNLLYFSLSSSIFFILAFILFLKKKRNIAVIIVSVFLTCSVVLCTYSLVLSSKKYAISRGCQLYSIPESKANSASEISAGNRVIIKEETDNWYYVELGTISGWCKKDNLILIR